MSRYPGSQVFARAPARQGWLLIGILPSPLTQPFEQSTRFNLSGLDKQIRLDRQMVDGARETKLPSRPAEGSNLLGTPLDSPIE